MLCAISGEAPQVPVVSTKSGNVFEKRLIEAYIAENGKDPVTGEDLSTDDLVELKTARVVRPRPPTLTSIPSLLGVFQEEWDALALETYTLRQALVQTRQELSTALYQHDAAVRVIARLTKERDEARETLSKISVGSARAPAGGDAMQVDSAKIPDSVVARIEETQAKLSKSRIKRPIPEGWATSEAIQSYKPAVSSEPLYPGGKSLSVDSTGDLALVGGVDGIAGVYSISKQQIVQTLKVGSPITDAVFAGSTAVVASASGSVKFFNNGTETASFDSHAGEATAVVVHPTGDIVASVGADKSYVLYDLATSSVITQIYGNASKYCLLSLSVCAKQLTNVFLGLLSAKFHPDGHLLAVGGTDGQIQVYDVKSGVVAANFPMQAPVINLEFSENGYFMAAVTENSTDISIWDLRKSKLHKVLETGTKITTLAWDYTGQFLLSGGPNGITIQQYTKSTKEWSEPLRSAVPAVGVAWGPLAQSVLTINTEGVLNVLNQS
ncbi:cell cycle control protein (Cwf8), putative [Talaromyces stipitatus ATCC 10500]|uniref:Pre-mRNA-processing factor 19 n=1 Tax=Talaromyces stipitatus (strain ATCC 10500 / CBS 375.48 / QM 6759 / NRRL 1006) TaxID=441959 RepID=B8LYG3_TALSN|nr:cell cycle control protein (Cwf8), putative [Talaromyces stipitatus ATCC 10500]EED22892.1 cell cycle control protein (Cwf8), putative [Talaromyces stipitatus ATCC 10500]